MLTSEKSTLAPSITVAVWDVDTTHEKHDRGKGSIKCQTNTLKDRYETDLQVPVPVQRTQIQLKIITK